MCYGETGAAIHVRDGHDSLQRTLGAGEVRVW